MTSRNVTIDVRARTAQYERAMRGATRTTRGLGVSLSGVTKAAALGAAGVVAGLGAISVAAVKLGTDATQAFASFERELSKIEGLVGIAGDEVEAMGDQIRDTLSIETGRSAQELASGLFFITSAGLEGAEAMEALEVSAKAATAGLGDTAIIADVVTSAMNAYGDEIGSAEEATDVLVATVREGKAEAPQLAAAFGRVIPIASQMGVSLGEVGAALAAMTRIGLDANESATALRQIMTSLLSPTAEAEAALADMGLTVEEVLVSLSRDFLGGLTDLTAAFDGNAQATAQVFGNVRALTGVYALLGENAAATGEVFGNVTNAAGSTADAFGVAAETGAFAFEQAQRRIESALLGVGEEILPKLADAIDQIAPTLPALVSGLGELAISFAEFGAAAAPAVASFLDQVPLYVSGIQEIGLETKKWAEPFVELLDIAAGSWLDFGDAYTVADRNAALFLDTQQKVANALRSGFDPSAIAFTAIEELANNFTLTEENLARLQTQLGLSDQEFAAVERSFIQQADAAGRYGILLDVLREDVAAYNEVARQQHQEQELANDLYRESALSALGLGQALDEAAGAAGTTVLPIHEMRNALAEAAAEGKNLSEAMLELTSPTFKAQKAVERLNTAQQKAEEVRGDRKATAEEVAAAELAVVEATLQAQAALDSVDPAGLQASIDSIESVLGITEDEARDLLETLGVLDGSKVEVVIEFQTQATGPLAGAIQGRADINLPPGSFLAEGGPAIAGRPYIVGEQGPELMVPGMSGSVIPNDVLKALTGAGTKETNYNLTVVGSDRPAEDGSSLLLMARIGGAT